MNESIASKIARATTKVKPYLQALTVTGDIPWILPVVSVWLFNKGTIVPG